ncbi:hypothetical protein [Synechococcus sp. MIT S9510]|uniref:hypothetical protein n=1 Tax=Synechococcus sp. MIT S9510 TaxID=3082548 RepID=UPI0039AF80A7
MYLVEATLTAIKAGNIYAETDSRRKLKQLFKLSDEKISWGLFKRLTDAEVGREPFTPLCGFRED